MTCAWHLSALILKKVAPRLFLALSIKTLLIGVGLLALAAYLTFKHPEEMKRHPWLRRFKDSDWAQYLAGGIFFISFAIVGILSSLEGLGRELSEIEVGAGRGFLIAAVVALLFLLISKVVAKFNE